MKNTTTFNRLKLRRLIEAGKVTATSSYRFDDQYGAERGLDHEMPVRIHSDTDGTRFEEGVIKLWSDSFSGYGRASRAGTDKQGRELVVLYIHSNLNYTFAINTRRVPTPKELETFFAGTVPEFQKQIHDIAFTGGLPYLEVFKMWRQYSDANYDQSALLSEFKENYAVKLGLKKEVVIEDDKGNGETFTVTPQEAAGFEAYLQKHFAIPALALARIYFRYTRQGLDLMKMALPSDLQKRAPATNVIPFPA